MSTVLESYIEQLKKHQKERRILKISKDTKLNRATITRLLSANNSELRRLLEGMIELEKAGHLDPSLRFDSVNTKIPKGKVTVGDVDKFSKGIQKDFNSKGNIARSSRELNE